MDDRSAVWRNLEPETLPQPVFIPELTTSNVECESVTFVPSISDQDFMLFTRQDDLFPADLPLLLSHLECPKEILLTNLRIEFDCK